MRAWAVLSALLFACGSDPPPPALPPERPSMAPPPAEVEPPPPPAEPAPAEPTTLPPVEPTGPPSTATFEQATSAPEPVGLGDERAQLTDLQLQAPMRGALANCKIPAKAKVSVKTAVQNGRAIGVTVLVDMPAPKQPKKPTKQSKAAAKAHAKAVARITTCADQAVRALSWPPSRRRDAFTTTF